MRWERPAKEVTKTESDKRRRNTRRELRTSGRRLRIIMGNS
jgi:hypothetical protein